MCESSLLESWTMALTPVTPQVPILLEWPLHQGCAVVRVIINKLFEENFSEKEKKAINILTKFSISHKSGIKFFLK